MRGFADRGAVRPFEHDGAASHCIALRGARGAGRKAKRMASTPPRDPPSDGGSLGEFRDRNDASAYCAATIAPRLRCGHHVEQHLVHVTALLECWRCEDWHHFVPSRPRDLKGRDAA